ncbi:RNA 3'-terminal phosphate cyclase [Candidatus Woesearchaeota archaeon]|nr:RNA 3'-terminal phosphate cyclase [Candidatus Woesearchaeota archaeon]
MIKIDGSYLEAGGQILRTALTLSSLTLQPFEITNIRKGRPNPGLQPQHLACVKALEGLCNASSEGAEVGSAVVKFYPGKPQSRTLNIDIGTAGSITLLLQAVLLPALFAPGKVRLKLTGGTSVMHSQPVEYFSGVFLPHTASFGNCSFSLLRRGYFPKGGGKAELEIRPLFHLNDYDTFADFGKAISQQITGISLAERGKLLKIAGVSHASADLRKAEVAERQARSAKSTLLQQLQKINGSCPVSIQAEYSDSFSTGSGITLFAYFASAWKDDIDAVNPVILGADALGERGKRAEAVGQEAAAALVKEISSGACVDRYLADQLIPFMALAGNSNKGSSTPPLSTLGSLIRASEITNHCLTNIFVVEQFLGKCFEVDEGRKLIRTTE